MVVWLVTIFELKEGVFAVNFELASLTKKIEKFSFGQKTISCQGEGVTKV